MVRRARIIELVRDAEEETKRANYVEFVTPATGKRMRYICRKEAVRIIRRIESRYNSRKWWENIRKRWKKQGEEHDSKKRN